MLQCSTVIRAAPIRASKHGLGQRAPAWPHPPVPSPGHDAYVRDTRAPTGRGPERDTNSLPISTQRVFYMSAIKKVSNYIQVIKKAGHTHMPLL
jgi:hypothetical protein